MSLQPAAVLVPGWQVGVRSGILAPLPASGHSEVRPACTGPDATVADAETDLGDAVPMTAGLILQESVNHLLQVRSVAAPGWPAAWTGLTWDSVAGDRGYIVVIGVSFILLTTVTGYLQRRDLAQPPAPPAVRSRGDSLRRELVPSAELTADGDSG